MSEVTNMPSPPEQPEDVLDEFVGMALKRYTVTRSLTVFTPSGRRLEEMEVDVQADIDSVQVLSEAGYIEYAVKRIKEGIHMDCHTTLAVSDFDRIQSVLVDNIDVPVPHLAIDDDKNHNHTVLDFPAPPHGVSLSESQLQSVRSSCQSRCVICMGVFKQGDYKKVLPCPHEFHASCLRSWLVDTPNLSKGQCPICRTCIICHFADFDIKLFWRIRADLAKEKKKC